jgi:hypothetical protein
MSDPFNSLKSNIESALTNQPELASLLGIDPNTTVNKAGSFGALPWDLASATSDSEEKSFWDKLEIKPERWNQMHGYRLVVVDVTTPESPRVVSGDPAIDSTAKIVNSHEQVEGIGFVLNQEVVSGKWIVNLPITPQQLQITDQFAINTTATMRGVVEEHNGVKFKNITMAGTTGIWPTRPTKGGEIKSPTSVETIFAGTIEGFNNVVSGISSIKKAFSGEHPNSAPKDSLPDDPFSTGYYQMLYLGQFLERYAMAKRRPENKNWRLVLDIPKQNQSFVVTPLAYTFKQDAQRPNEMMYNLQLKAWKRIKLDLGTPVDQDRLPTLTINDFQRIVNTLREVRRTIGDASNLIKAVRNDFQRPFNILRQTTLAIKDLGGVVYSAIDLPRQLVEDFQDVIEDSLNNLTSAFQRPNDRFRDTAGAGSFRANAVSLKQATSAQKAGQASIALSQKRRQNEGLSSSQVASGALGSDAADSLDTDPLNNIFQNPEENFDFFDAVSMDSLELSPQQEEAFDTELERVSLLNINDFREFKAEILDLALDISNSFGAGDDTFASVYGTSDPRDRPIPMSVEENEVLDALYDAIQVYDELTATKFYDDLDIQSPLEYVGGLADETDITFEDFQSKKPVPVPFGSTIEEIAARYMGDSDKWLEIVTLNKLRSPYIDEEGFVLEFLSNGSDRQFTVLDDQDRLYIGQKILLQSDTVPQFSRKIINLEEIGEDNFLVTVDGLANLDTLTLNSNARMQGFLPGTVNSQNQIFIPTDQASVSDDRTFEIAGLADPYLTRISKVDWLLTEDGDIALNSTGDLRFSNGLTNLIQSLKMKIRTQKGTLLRHLDYGLGLSAGVSISDISRGAIVEALNRMLKDDPRFDGIDRIALRLNGSTLGIDMVVRIPNASGILPISLDVPIR